MRGAQAQGVFNWAPGQQAGAGGRKWERLMTVLRKTRSVVWVARAWILLDRVEAGCPAAWWAGGARMTYSW